MGRVILTTRILYPGFVCSRISRRLSFNGLSGSRSCGLQSNTAARRAKVFGVGRLRMLVYVLIASFETRAARANSAPVIFFSLMRLIRRSLNAFRSLGIDRSSVLFINYSSLLLANAQL